MAGESIENLYNAGLNYHHAGRWAEAKACYEQILGREPNNAMVLNLLGLVAHQAGALEPAEKLIRQAISIQPANSDFQNNLGIVLVAKGDLAGAETAFRLGIKLKFYGAQGHNNLAGLLRRHGKLAEAVESFRTAISLDSTLTEAHLNLAICLIDLDRLPEAEATMQKAVELNPLNPHAHYRKGSALYGLGRIGEAMACTERALELKPDLAEAHVNLAIMRLMTGDLARGWGEYEWRHGSLRALEWKGEELGGAEIVLHCEQGAGDSIQFIRYAKKVVERGGRVVVAAPAELEEILGRVEGVSRVIRRGGELPAGAKQISMMSVANALGTTLETIPQDGPYISARAEDVEKWRGIVGDGSGKRVGLVWAGSAKHPNDRNRSCGFEVLRPMIEIPGVRFFGLQTGEVARQSAGSGVVDWSSRLGDFSQSAAAVANVDLVITVDTSIAHLAGAMGKACWVMLPFVADWRWLMGREDSPWYPTVRLFRQTARGDWGSVVEKIAKELRA